MYINTTHDFILLHQNDFLVQIIIKGTKRARAHIISKSSALKKLARGIASKSHNTIGRQATKNIMICQRVLSIIARDIQNEMTALCSKNFNSILRQSSFEAIQNFSWKSLSKELRVVPTLYRILSGCTNVTRRVISSPKNKREEHMNETVLGVCASILLCHRNIAVTSYVATGVSELDITLGHQPSAIFQGFGQANPIC